MTAASNNNNNNTITIPDAWPPEVRERYQPIRELGRGGFASVILAKDNDDNQLLVAMKIVGGSGKDAGATTGARLSMSIKNDSTYAHREIDILKDISHPNIMKCIDYWESSKDTKLYSATMALSYSKGPTLEGLLQYGGALSTTFARTVLSQVVDAIAYLHYHAVVHRDIKPDNVIITGAFKNQDTIWDISNEEEQEEEEGDASNNGKNKKPEKGDEKKPEQSKTTEESEAATTTKADDDDDKSLKRFDTTFTSDTVRAEIEAQHWKTLRQKWKVTLVDFGFARALTPEDVASPSLDLKNENTKAAFSTRNLTKGAAGNDADSGGIDSSRRKQRSNFLSRSRHSLLLNLSRHSMSNLNDSSSVNRSIHFKRQMSALGNRNFAAPEIVNKVRHDKTSMTASGGGGNGGGEGADDGMDITQTISEYVAEYGLMVDAYSLGHTIRYCMTGVPPYMGVEEAIQDENSLCNKLCGTGGGGKNKKTGIRSPHYRRVSESPAEAQRLITNLCQSNEKNRTSVRKVRQTYPWIYQTFSEEENETSPWVSESRSKVEYLQCAMTKSSSSSKNDDNDNNNKTKVEEEQKQKN